MGKIVDFSWELPYNKVYRRWRMHKMNVVGIVFRGAEGKKAIQQILRAKPVKNKFTTTVEERSAEFVANFQENFGSVTVSEK